MAYKIAIIICVIAYYTLVDTPPSPSPVVSWRNPADETQNTELSFEYAVLNDRHNDCDDRIHHTMNRSTTTINEYINKQSLPYTALITMNGMNDGGYVIDAAASTGCLHTVAKIVASASTSITSVDLVYPVHMVHSDGTSVHSDDTLAAGAFYHVILDGDAFMWAGVRVGYEWSAAGARYTTVSLSSPRIIIVRDALTSDECDRAIHTARSNLRQSGEKHYSDQFKNWRTSKSAGIGGDIGRWIQHRSWQIARTPGSSYPESSQLVQYSIGKRYREHHDRFRAFKWHVDRRWHEWIAWLRASIRTAPTPPPVIPSELQPSDSNEFESAVAALLLADERYKHAVHDYEPQLRQQQHPVKAAMARNINVFPMARAAFERATNNVYVFRKFQRLVEPNRFATLFYYLNSADDDDEWALVGGETIFTKVKRPSLQPPLQPRKDMPECNDGLYIVPEKGAAALFYNVIPPTTGVIDVKASHGGCPPLSGQKWGVNSFIWNTDSQWGAQQQYKYSS